MQHVNFISQQYSEVPAQIITVINHSFHREYFHISIFQLKAGTFHTFQNSKHGTVQIKIV
jgi:hypothetical protein